MINFHSRKDGILYTDLINRLKSYLEVEELAEADNTLLEFSNKKLIISIGHDLVFDPLKKEKQSIFVITSKGKTIFKENEKLYSERMKEKFG